MMQTYFDHNATSPLHPEVVEATLPYLKNPVANASSLHRSGSLARSAIETARARIAALEMEHRRHHLLQLREVFETRLTTIPAAVVFGQDAERLPNITYFSLSYYHGETLLRELNRAGFALASGSACHSEETKPSHVLTAMGVDENLALNAVRVSFGMSNTLQEVDALVSKLQEFIDKLPAVFRQAAV